MPAIKKPSLRPFEVLENTTNGELGLIIEIAGTKVILADRTGKKALFKLTPEFVKVADRDGFSLAAIAGMRRLSKEAAERAKQASNEKRKATLAAKKAARAQAA
jgi:hypothetical protein